MKRLLLFFVTFLSLTCFGQTQTKATTSQAPPVQMFMNYLIKLNTLAEGKYGHNILYQGKPVVSQKLNPFTLFPNGLSRKEDAFRIARRQVQQLAAGAPPELFSGRPLPSGVAKQLNIALD